VTVLVKLEFGDRVIGESAKVDCSADQESEVNYSTSLMVSSEDVLLIDEVASKPLLCMLTLIGLLIIDHISTNKEQHDSNTKIAVWDYILFSIFMLMMSPLILYYLCQVAVYRTCWLVYATADEADAYVFYRCFLFFLFVFFAFCFFPFATKIPDNRSRERLNGFS